MAVNEDSPVPPLVVPSVPVMPVDAGKPVQLVKVPEAGVPKTGAVIVGLVKVLFVSVSVVFLATNVSLAAGTFRLNVDAVFGPTKLT